MAAPTVTERDRAYMRRLGELERVARAEWLGYLETLPIAERLRRSLERTARSSPYPRKEPEDLAAIYERAGGSASTVTERFGPAGSGLRSSPDR